LQLSVIFKDDKEEGPVEKYHPNGQLFEKYSMKDGKEDGLYQGFDDMGNLRLVRVYRMGTILQGAEAESYLAALKTQESNQSAPKRIASSSKGTGIAQQKQSGPKTREE